MIIEIIEKKKEKEFEPFTIALTFECLSELKEFELRMALYRSYLVNAANSQTDLCTDIPHRPGQSTFLKKLGSLRNLLHAKLGDDSDIKNPCWWGWMKGVDNDAKYTKRK